MDPASRAGLKSGNVIIQVDKHEVNDVASLGDVLLNREIISHHENLDEDTTMNDASLSVSLCHLRA
jgi:C-terminal processing protease CtpA/Prc